MALLRIELVLIVIDFLQLIQTKFEFITFLIFNTDLTGF
jgi:hypothetical protein